VTHTSSGASRGKGASRALAEFWLTFSERYLMGLVSSANYYYQTFLVFELLSFEVEKVRFSQTENRQKTSTLSGF